MDVVSLVNQGFSAQPVRAIGIAMDFGFTTSDSSKESFDCDSKVTSNASRSYVRS
ncbi:MAG: hypothetical protein ACI89X_003159 [Planctomycetota bacterium]|jgi:hypothetical protein